MKDMNVMIFTDMDGTLLNHNDYRFDEAKPMLEWLQTNHIPIILTTSKTRAEVEQWQVTLEIQGPFITENGAGVFDAHKQAIGHYKNYDEIRTIVRHLQTKYPIRGFGDMETAEVAALTNMSLENCQLSMQREFSEPFLYAEESLPDSLYESVQQQGLRILKGGRFYHLLDQRASKGEALKIIVGHLGYRRDETRIIALGDSPNDFAMLEEADTPILIPHPDGRYESPAIPNLIQAPQPGSLGWNLALERIFHGE